MPGSKWAPVVVLLACLCKAVVCVPPRFDKIGPIQEPENTPAGTVLGVLTVKDTTPSHITVTMSTTTQQYVYLNQHTSDSGSYNASIGLQRPLDYETDGSSLRLLFTATNPSTPDGVRQYVTVIITDVNDVHPRFQGLPYSVSVPENESNNTVIFTANSTDPDTGIGGLVNYSMQTSHADYTSKFKVSRTGKVTLIGDLDYETLSFYQFTIVATDGGGLTSEAQLFVTVTDVQDSPPYFTGGPYLPHIWEDHTVNSSVVTISALDGDRGNPNNITYNITDGTCPGYFNVDPTSGSIDLIKDADRDSGIVLQNNGICVINIQAVEVTSSGTFGATANDTVTVTIKDKNDNLPTFNSSHYEATILENMPAGIPITFTTQTVHVEDLDQGDNAKLSLTLDSYSSTYFEIVPSTVQGSANLLIRVKDNTILDYEQIQSITLTVWANETSTPEGNSASTTIHLKITNQNDNSPNFTRSDYSASVREGSNVSTSVITVKALDLDLPNFGAVNYSLRGDDGMFAIDSSGLVTVASHQLDRETKSVYYISVEATDPGGLKDTAQLTVNITDANDNAPVFGRDYDGYLKENDTSFSRPITVSAKDDDVGVNAQVTYSINRTYPSGLDAHFAVDGVSGVLSVPSPLDYETVNSSLVVVSVRATDNGTHQLYSDVNVTLTLQDINDNTPVFQPGSYKHSIPERTGTGSSVITVSATDDDGTDPNNVIYYTIVSGDDGRFRINPNSGEISTSGILDYESKTNYSMTVMVQDRGSPERNSTALVEIGIINVNDEMPVFGASDKTVSVNESIAWNRHVEDFSATDADPDSLLQYTITHVSGINEDQQTVSSQVQNWFRVNSSTGEITVSDKIDRETAQQVTLSLQVNDTNASVGHQPQNDAGTLVINILDADDNAPTFNDITYNAFITENMDRGTPITFRTPDSMNVSDPDLRDNSYLSLTLSGPYAGYFTISPNTVQSSVTLSIRVDNSSILDYEKEKSLTLTVVASEPRGDNHLESNCTVTLSILDANDNDPEFLNVPYTASVSEHAANNTPVYKVNATDVDTGQGGDVTFTLQGDQTYFSIDTISGQVYTKGKGLDRERTDTYFLTVQATDGGGRRQTTLLTVSITDYNDEVPIFKRDYYDGNLIDGQDAFTRPIIVEASDDDESNTPNSEVRYSITSWPVGLQNNFTVDPVSGVMTVNGLFDYESLDARISDTLTFNLTASDQGSPVLSSSVVVNISIQDTNDFSPEFDSPIYTASVKEDIGQGQKITRVGATDGDRTSPNKDIFYLIDSGGLGKFRIDSSSGDILRAGELDRESEAYYSLIVVAMDRGTPSLSSSSVVNISVTDVNDVGPVFNSSSLSVDVNETTLTHVLFTAFDPDKDANLTYSIDWTKSYGVDGKQNRTSSAELKSVISIEELTGEVVISSNLDRERMELVTLVIGVRDENGTPGQTATGTLNINVVDVDDNMPQFNNDTFVADIKENMATGIPISFKVPSSMTVSDKDQGENSWFELSLVGSTDFTPVPKLVRSSATVLITVTNPDILDYERSHSVNFTIMAKEQYGNGFNTTAFVQLSILDVNDNDPKFVKPEYSAEIREDKTNGTSVVNVTATDNDSAIFGMGTYTLQGGQNLFDINNITGEVTVASHLDRERQSQYFLTVVATDKGGRRSTVQLTVNVTDYNDNAPVFTRDAYDAVLNENSIAFGKTVKVQATDLDEGTNAEIRFSLYPSTYSSNFTINDTSGEISPRSALDYELLNRSIGGLIELLVVATDRGNPALSSNVTLSIQVQDLNDKAPEFVKSSYRYNITENSNISSQVGNVLAQDGDGSPPNNDVFYLIQSGSSDKFTIDSGSGDIVTSGSLDRETEAQYNLTVVAIDRGNPPLSGTATVTVNIININDETPVFSQSSVTLSVAENKGISQVLHTLSAQDDDEDASLNYTIVWSESEAFDDKQASLNTSFLKDLLSVDSSTGSIILKQTLDRETVETIKLAMYVEDENAQDPSPQTATATITFIVLDENDNDPKFDSSIVNANIDENAQPGTPISFSQSLALGVSDLDKDVNSVFNLSLSAYTDNFELVPVLVRSSASVLVRVKNNTILDYEKRSNISFSIIAMETETSEHQSSSAQVTLVINDINDHDPDFSLPSYTANVTENSPNGTSVLLITATDADSSKYGMGTYSFQRGEDKFAINATSGEVYVTGPLDRETKSQYSITVQATDLGQRTQSVALTINITDRNDETPRFQRKDYSAVLVENSNAFIRPLQVQATDDDEPNTANSRVVYSIISAFPNLDSNFSVNPSSGLIQPVTPIDYDTLSNHSIVLVVVAADEGVTPKSSNVTVSITLEDINDNSPTFTNPTYGSSISEASGLDAPVVTVIATDADGSKPNNQVFYLIESGASDAFKIDGTSGKITVAGDLDRETIAKYTLLVKAMDRGSPVLSSFVNVTVNILDVNDEDPKFYPDVQFASVNETGPSEQLYTFNATDPDKDSSLSYDIYWDGSSGRDDLQNNVNKSYLQSVVNISQSSGEVVTIAILDRESLTAITLVVVVKDTNANTTGQTATGTLSITVMDINDNSPTFSNTTYSAEVLENMPEGTPITFTMPTDMRVADADYETNSEFQLTVDGEFAGVFTPVPTTVRSSSSVILRVQNSSWLDYEEHNNFTIRLTARETQTSPERNSTATVHIQILDANDNSPTFVNTSYSVTIGENTNNQTSIVDITATDPDSDRYTMGTYTLSGSENKFDIDINTGEVKVVAVLDREMKSQYFMTVTAEDKGGRKQTVPLTVTLSDFNDNSPQFRVNEYFGNIKENQNNFSTEVRVSTTDADLAGTNNTAVFYSIQSLSIPLSTNFSINRAGVLTCLSPIDYEAPAVKSRNGILHFLVVAKDGGIPQMSSNVTVTIHVEDMNDNPPLFTNEPYTASIPENATDGTFVLNVSATDQDGETPNNQVMFVIDSGGSDNFRVNGRTGRITVQTGAALNREREANYSLVVVTIDQGTPPLSSNTTVIVNITDVNDQPPAFSVDSSSASFTENSTGICSFTFNATDPDEISLLNYTILWDRSLAYDERGGNVNISLVKDWFSVNATTGDLCSLPAVIDRETAESITIMVQVRDLKAEEHIDKQTATASVSVTIGDINDNYPQIVQGNNIAVNVSEGTPVGTVIKTLEATDRDLRQTVTFSTSSVDFNITKKGRISLAKKLDRETATTVNFIISATDDGSPPLTSTSTINIVVLDTNDNDPQFSMPTYSFYVSEDSTNGTVVATVTATDKDEGHNANVTYLLGDDKGGLFRMDSITGYIILEGSLDREYVRTYSLTVTARDNPVFETPRLKRTTITIVVTDVNDNSPQFDTDYHHVISEKTNQGVAILTVHATDEDIGNNGKVWYSLQDETVNPSDLFAINATTGAITAARDLLGLADIYTLTVVATDEGTGNLTGNATVTITVLDENLNKPVFVNVTDIPPIPECSRVDSQIFQFFATDADKDKVHNGRVEFNMTVDTPDDTKLHFRLDKSTGSLKVNRPLNSEVQSTFTLKVLAYDLGSPSLSTISKQYTIKLKDINDNPPEFNNSYTRQKHFSVPENVINTQLGPIRAEDPDKDSQICYTLSDSIYIVNLKKRPATDNRTLFLDVVLPFDRENVTSFTVKITATDCSPSFYSHLCDNSSLNSTTVTPSSLITTITILDKNDNPPVYRQPVLSKGIRNTVTLGRIIFELDTLVYDRDSPEFSRHAFYRVNATEADPTLLNTFNPEKHPIPISLTENGTVATNMSFSANMYGFFNMKVAVSDIAGMDMAELKIFIIADFQVLKITFLQSIDDVLRIQDDVLRDMSNATGYTFLTNDDVASHLDADGNIQPYHSDMFVHAVDPLTGKILDAENTRRIIDRNQALGSKLINKYKVTQIGEADASVAKRDDSERRMYILISVVCLLSFTLLLLIYISCNRIQRYRRKLKAATIDVKGPKHEETEETGNVNFNPLFNKDIAMQEEMDSTSIVSGDSLDNNMVLDGNTAKKDDEQEFTVNFFDEKQQIRYGNNALGEVLRQYDFIDEEMGTRGHDMEDSASSSSEQGNSRTNGKLMMKRDQDLGDVDNLESTDI